MKAYVQGPWNQEAPCRKQNPYDNMKWVGPIPQPKEQGITVLCLDVSCKEQ